MASDYNQLTGSDSTDTINLIQRLCPDILAEIFTFCLPDVPKESWQVERTSSRKAPLLLCSVCSSWRSLAISTPRLWQTLHIFANHDEKLTIDTESITNGIRTWLDRSRALPLSIRAIFWTEDPESNNATECRLILDVLSQEASRWESFELHEAGIWLAPPHFGILPMLHTFDISGSLINGIPLTAAPRLKKLGWNLSLRPNPTSILVIPWDQLVKLTIGDTLTTSIAVEIIQRCPRLESLWILVKDESSPTFRSITQHDALQRLHITVLPYVNAITDCLTLPALTDLSLWTQCSGFSTPQVERRFCSQLVAFFTRSNCKLQELALCDSDFGPGELLDCLSHRSCQTLTHLDIQSHDSLPPMVDRELLIRLTYSDVDDNVPLCPKLRHLQLCDCYCSDMSFPDLLGRMIQSRCFGHTQDAQLRSLRLFNRYSVSREDYELLQFAQSNGGLELECPYTAANNSNAIPGGGTGTDVDVDEGNIGNVDG